MIEIPLPPSKSIALRVLALHAAAGKPLGSEDWDFCDDTAAMRRGLLQRSGTVSAGAGAAPFRFMTAIFAATPGTDILLTGTDRLLARPVAPLVEALGALGADISIEDEGLRIHGKNLRSSDTACIRLDASLSSQFISALLLASPLLPPLDIRLSGSVPSRPYLEMTISMLRSCGADVTAEDDRISVSPFPALRLPDDRRPEGDWSAASYIYELALLNPGREILLPALLPPGESLQGDSRCAEIFAALGVTTRFTESGAVICFDPLSAYHNELNLNMNAVPDAVPAVVAASLLAGRHFRLAGLSTLRHKESDRINALVEECGKLGFVLEASDSSLEWDGKTASISGNAPAVDSHCDHRMAMALYPLVRRHGASATLLSPQVVTKSFPEYFKYANLLIDNI